MTILSKLLRLLRQSGEMPSEAESERVRSKRTEQVIEQYDEMLNAGGARRQRRPDLAGNGDIDD
jgi:hypothetical protein